MTLLAEMQRLLDVDEMLRLLELSLQQAPSEPRSRANLSPEDQSSLHAAAQVLDACVAARYLAVAQPQTLSIIGSALASDLAWLIEAVYPDITVLRASDDLESACASDIVMVFDTTPLDASWFAEGTHVSAPTQHRLQNELPTTICSDLADLIVGRFPPRQGAEISFFQLSAEPQSLGFLMNHLEERKSVTGS